MIGLIQRVSSAAVTVEGQVTGEIGRGILLLLGVEAGDSSPQVARLADKVMSYRIFPDPEGRMNLSLKDIDGELLVVSQFTLAADTRKGLRPSFTSAASPELAERLYEEFCAYCARSICKVTTGRFGADMKVTLCNDGPVTFWLQAQ